MMSQIKKRKRMGNEGGREEKRERASAKCALIASVESRSVPREERRKEADSFVH